MKKIVFALTALIILSCQTPKKIEEPPVKQLSKFIDQYAEEALQKGNINSIAVAVYRDGNIYQNYYGEIDGGAQNMPNDSTLYEIASITKVFAGSLAAKAVIENKITLDDDIRKYLEGEYPNLEYQNTPITIRDLLTHTLGLKNKTPKGLEEVNEKTDKGYYESRGFSYAMTDLLEELKTVELDKKPGTFYAYNSVGPELVAYILEQVYHKPYMDLLNTFLNELNMNNTYLLGSENDKKRPSNGYNSDGKRSYLSKNPLLGGAAGMVSTLPDLIEFMKFQFESEDPLIKESTHILFEDDDDNTMGYLWQDLGIAEEEGFYYSKTGTSKGVQSGLLICPGSNYGQIVIINNNSDASYSDWGTLFNTIETDLIKFPKINLKSVLKPLFLKDKEAAKKQFQILSKQEDTYFNTDLPWVLNRIGYDLLHVGKVNKAVEIFDFAIAEYPENANLYDSRGQVYFENENYEKALMNYKKSLELNPENDNAKKYISEIDLLKSK
jgi:CubicO group peptidase (beta-lactamase class C family)